MVCNLSALGHAHNLLRCRIGSLSGIFASGSSMGGSLAGTLGTKVSNEWLGYSRCGISILIRGNAGRLNEIF